MVKLTSNDEVRVFTAITEKYKGMSLVVQHVQIMEHSFVVTLQNDKIAELFPNFNDEEYVPGEIPLLADIVYSLNELKRPDITLNIGNGDKLILTDEKKGMIQILFSPDCGEYWIITTDSMIELAEQVKTTLDNLPIEWKVVILVPLHESETATAKEEEEGEFLKGVSEIEKNYIQEKENAEDKS